MPYYIAFDIGHKPRGNIDDNYTELRDLLSANDFQCHNIFETSITRESLEPYDILVFACPDFAKISRQEILEIEAWVKNDGGGLLLLSHAGGDKGRNSNLSDLSELFGIRFENDQVLDEEENIGLENMPIVNNFNPPHPITSGLDSVCYRAGCSLTVIGSGFAIVSSNETSEPFSSPLICVSEPEKGRIVCGGSYEMFRDRIGGGLQFEGHSKLALNIFEWLISDYRMEQREKELLPVPEKETEENLEEIMEEEEISIYDKDLKSSLQGFNVSLDISNESELLNLLKHFLNQINTMKGTIENIISSISKTEGQSEKSKKSTEEIKENLSSKSESQKREDYSVDDIRQEIQKKEKEGRTSKNEISREEDEERLSNLPTKPESRDKKDKVDSEGKPVLTDVPKKESEEEEAEIEPVTKGERREELEAEIEKLERKVKSIVNLLGFLEKKYKSGKMDEKAYNKQSKKLHKNLDKIKRRIEKISSALNQ